MIIFNIGKIKGEIAFSCLTCVSIFGFSQNPIVPNQGLNDPHIHIFNDTAYVYASHDKSADNKSFIMEDWWIWSSPDLVNWKKESVLKPKDTYMNQPFNGCWATDVGCKDGRYYWYFSEKNEQTGVVVGNSPTGPWEDVLGKPLLAKDLTPTHEYDIAIFEEDGNHYIIFGVWDYYIAKLNSDMVSLAEIPKKIEIQNPRGPYNQDGLNKEMPTDDKPFVHKYNDKYYLSWGCFYAMSDDLYGPYDYKDSIIDASSFAEGYDAPTWPNSFAQGRHGSFFEWHNQWYFAYCDISQTGNRYFRDTFISYVHYKDNGTMASIRVDGIGVGRYEVSNGKIQAEDFFKAEGLKKVEIENGFAMETDALKSYLFYPNIEGIGDSKNLRMSLFTPYGGKFKVELKASMEAEAFSTQVFEFDSEDSDFTNMSFSLPMSLNAQGLYILIEQEPEKSLLIDAIEFN